MMSFDNREEVKGLSIDPRGSRDIDDAIWLEVFNGGYVLHVSIADVASAIPLGSPLDQEAFQKAFTRYFAQGNNPMLPRELSEDALSLLEGQMRATITVSIPLSDALDVGYPQIRFTQLSNKAAITYDEADIILGDKTHPLHSFLSDCNILAQRLLQSRRTKGALAIYDVNHGWATSEEGFLREIDPSEAHLSHIIIQEFMILTNEVMATFLVEKGVLVLFRNHTAKAHAVEREHIFTDISYALGLPEQFDIRTLQRRINIMLNRATYGPKLEGHYGLNVPAYAHFTSPIRRYADVVVHRVLRALLTGDTAPYGFGELEAIASYLTEIDQRIKDESRQYLIRKVDVSIRKAVKEKRFDLMDANQFSHAIRIACAEDKIYPPFVSAILDSIENGKLLVRDIHAILLEAKGSHKAWPRIKEAALKWLLQHPGEVESLFQLARQNSGWPEVTLDIEPPNHLQVNFVAIARIHIGEKEYISCRYASHSKKLARHGAAADLLMKVVGITLDQAHIAREEVITQDKVSQNYKGMLMERCQQLRVVPKFDTSMSGLSHKPEFSCVATVALNDKVFSSQPCQGPTRKEAEQNAAQELLKVMTGSLSLQSKEVAVSAVPSSIQTKEKPLENFKGKLQELCNLWGGSDPDYDTRDIGTERQHVFSSVVNVQIKGAQYVSDTCQGKTKREAEQNAAGNLLGALPFGLREESERQSVSAALQSENHVGALEEYCIKNSLLPPTYTFSRRGPAHKPYFISQCMAQDLEGRSMKEASIGPDKKTAKSRVAKEVLTKIIRIK